MKKTPENNLTTTLLCRHFFALRLNAPMKSNAMLTSQVHVKHFGKMKHKVEPSSSYSAVSIKAGMMACKAAQAIGDCRFLATDAPSIPLPDCDQSASCKCKYQYWQDRRGENRRLSDDGFGNSAYYGEEKRETSRGRRSTD